ncbi:hypothetical protein GH5_04831 [Leishmania sp. Ghana 2012 LV757]|uniref:hypothetical protein n=1 Tax=Leishmania sp. Ghana 2012 LV757 TaxID=2803181 RepID=UPI001B416BDC|nr:hypothetical protein GH5_04831 [Leishmania sp. Ghana 2012 LV757]
MSSGDDAPPHKYLAAEHAKQDRATPVAAREHIRGPSELSARARFLRELEQYASDDDDHGDKADVVDVGAGPRQHANHANGAPQRSSGSLLASATCAASSSVRPSNRSDFFFSGEDDPHDQVDDDTVGDEVENMASTGSTKGSTINDISAVPPRIGLELLRRMHASNTSGGRSSSGRGTAVNSAAFPLVTHAPSAPQGHTSHAASAGVNGAQYLPLAPTSSGDFEVVHAYVPLSTGGFLSTASAQDDTMEGHQVCIGDVLSLRKPLGGAAPPPSNLGASALASPPTASTAPLPTAPSTLTTTAAAAAGAATTGSTVEAVARKAMTHFKRAATFTAEEEKYGRQLTPDMMRLIFEVARVNQRGRSIEALFLDGTRAKVSFFEVRPAGYVERKIYAMWKADPASRPVHTIHSNASSPTTSSAPHGAVLPSPASPPQPSVAGGAWWVIPRLLVRLTTEAAGDWYGKKCVVKSVQRSERRVRLMEWAEEGRCCGVGESGRTCIHSCGKPATAAVETRELIGVEGIETVVPKKGGRAMVVLGSRRGEMCTVRSRVRGADGELTAVEVEMSRTKELVTLHADELCALAR